MKRQRRDLYGRNLRRVLLVVLCLFGVYQAWPVMSLQVRGGPEDDILKLALPLRHDSGVTLGFVQSVYQVNQEERYVIRDGELRLASVYFGSFDALNYYDPLELYTRKKVQGGYEIILNPLMHPPVCFATAHRTKMWLKIDDRPPILLERFAHGLDTFSLHMERLPRAVARLVEVTHG